MKKEVNYIQVLWALNNLLSVEYGITKALKEENIQNEEIEKHLNVLSNEGLRIAKQLFPDIKDLNELSIKLTEEVADLGLKVGHYMAELKEKTIN